MTRDEQARQRLVEIALKAEATLRHSTDVLVSAYAAKCRESAGFRDPSKGSWCAAGLTAAMADAGLLVPAPGTPARRGAIALLDFVAQRGPVSRTPDAALAMAKPGDIIAWLQHPAPDPAGWRRGHVAVIVAVDDESITTVGWNEGPSPGRVMMRRLWRAHGPCAEAACLASTGVAGLPCRLGYAPRIICKWYRPRSFTVLWRRDGGLYGVARPVAR